jgi:phage terminase large subunit-like protein
MVFPPSGDDTRYTVIPYYWLPENAVEERTRRDHVPYAVWNKQGIFNLTEGSRVDYEYIVAHIAKLSKRYRIKEIAYDMWGADKMRRDMEELGAENGFEVVMFGQGFRSMSPPSKDFFMFVSEGKIRHGNHPVLNWNVGNTVIQTDAAGNIKPHKGKSTEKIDGRVALLMGLARATIHSGVQAESVYESRGLLVL